MASDDNRGDEGTDDPSDVSEERLPAYAKRRLDAAAKENAILEAQNRADQVARHWGKRAQLAMVGEPLRSYRRRLLKPFQQYSPDYKAVDLALICDPQTFAIAEKTIYRRCGSCVERQQPAAPGRAAPGRSHRPVRSHGVGIRRLLACGNGAVPAAAASRARRSDQQEPRQPVLNRRAPDGSQHRRPRVALAVRWRGRHARRASSLVR